ncbi:MAG: 4-hydroxy-tetrahydrodipicolinate reductase [Sphingomonadaceae bacterium]|uniref:4-hydroxy-tetrahydrodipicolinate reductase n=1 Tax=Thermaurantiacus sp. TaxID=2820283 RepID=UPI00298EDB03|nr:4-hydroxy-tetrahydrodipicolinate reductase [Thermaurantiacus sp.]MCS6986269.1 4-hydroxy-tetrahydrodipicolinate reductase [Sphingomonadaceae bacterium]MDW8415718.1 4-hydroxy-tetrahydrodipicolinate reductase [Thermaurantiacus sp.]
MAQQPAGRLKVGVIGAGGRMGQALLAQIAAAPDLELAGAVERPGHPSCGQPVAGGLIVCANVAPVAHRARVLVDFSTPEALPETVRAAEEADCALVVGTTGLGPEHEALLDRAARTVPVLASANMSVGVHLLARLVEEAARRLGPEFDVELMDLHHRAKRDAPSGTALLLAEAAARGRGRSLAELRLPPPQGVSGPRPPGGIGLAALRGGSAAGEHRVWFLGPGERVELAHVAEDRAIFARGALVAARWLAGRPPGRYAMAEVLG